MRFLELIPKVQEEVRLFRAIAITEGRSKRTKHCLVVISCLNAEERLVVEDFLKFLSLLSTCQTEEYIVIGTKTILALKLDCNKFVGNKFYIANTCKRHLLFHIMSKTISSDYVSIDMRDFCAEQQTSI